MSAFEIYLLWTVIPGLQGLSVTLVILCGIVTLGAIGVYLEPALMPDHKPLLLRLARVAAAGFLLGVLGAAFIPNRKAVAVIVAGAYGTSIEGVGALPQEMVDAARTALQRYVEEAKP